MNDPVQHEVVLGGAAGGLFWGMIQVFAVVSAPSPPKAWVVVRLVVEAVFALASGVWGARYVGPAICARFHMAQGALSTRAGVAVGATFWGAAGAAIKTAVAFAPKLTDAVLQRITGVKA